MTRFGVSLVESVHGKGDGPVRTPPDSSIGPAIDALPYRPQLVSVWARGFQVDACAIDAIRARGVEPVVYATSHGLGQSQSAEMHATIYRRVIGGHHDAILRAFARKLPLHTAVRIDPEPNRTPGVAHWQRVDPKIYREGFAHMSRIIKDERPDLRIIWCLAWRGRVATRTDGTTYWPSTPSTPGANAVDIVGTDLYTARADWQDREALPSERLAAVVDEFGAMAQPLWITETAIARWESVPLGRVKVPGHGKWYRDHANVTGIGVVMFFPFAPPEEPHHDWRPRKGGIKAMRELMP